ncbi:MAG TPA: DJ-1/PfpI family protein [Steroidobacteraceae bacterium]|nr:DJ-1/PfpI family protein [Steroidobacteraceae bacterium]
MEWKAKLEASARKRRKFRVRLVLAVLVLVLGGIAAWFISLPPTPVVRAPPPVPQSEMDAILAALQPKKRPSRPVIAVLGINEGTETTDFLMPYGILKRADVADVIAVATRPGSITLFPVLEVMPEATVDQFDAKYPEGADYVIVPAMKRDDDPDAIRWIRKQAEKGAFVVGVCAGAMVVANTGLLDGKRATTHWYYEDRLLREHRNIEFVPDRRFVADEGVLTTTGISASMPMSLTMIESIAGREKAQLVAAGLGLTYWDARHRSDQFVFSRRFATNVVRNKAQFWSHEDLGMELTPGVDEVSLALAADVWSRTFRSRAVTFSSAGGLVTTRTGLKLKPELVSSKWNGDGQLAAVWGLPPALALDAALADVGRRFGKQTREVVAIQLERGSDF